MKVCFVPRVDVSSTPTLLVWPPAEEYFDWTARSPQWEPKDYCTKVSKAIKKIQNWKFGNILCISDDVTYHDISKHRDSTKLLRVEGHWRLAALLLLLLPSWRGHGLYVWHAKSLWHEHGRREFIKFWLGYFSVSTESRAFGQMATLYHVICIWVVMWSCQTVRSPSYIMLISVIESSIGVLLPECSILEAETTFCNDLSGLVSDSYASLPDSMAAFQPVSAEAIDGKKLLDVFSWGSPYHAKGKQESVS